MQIINYKSNFLIFLQAHFPTIILRPGELYEHMVHYKFGTLRSKAPLTRLSELDDIEYIDTSITENIEDDVYEDMSADVTSASKSDIPEEGSKAETSLEGSKTNIREEGKPQSAGAIKKQEKKETSEVNEEAAALAKIDEKAAEKLAEKAQEAVEVQVPVEEEVKEELKKETKKYKIDAECQTGAAATLAKVVKEKKEAEAQTKPEEEDEELQGACGGAPKGIAKK